MRVHLGFIKAGLSKTCLGKAGPKCNSLRNKALWDCFKHSFTVKSNSNHFSFQTHFFDYFKIPKDLCLTEKKLGYLKFVFLVLASSFLGLSLLQPHHHHFLARGKNLNTLNKSNLKVVFNSES